MNATHTLEHLAFAGLAWALLFVFVIGFPAYGFFIVHKLWRSQRLGEFKLRSRFGFLYRGTRPQFIFFRPVVFLTNFILVLDVGLQSNVITDLVYLVLAYFLQFAFVAVYVRFVERVCVCVCVCTAVLAGLPW